MTGLDNIGSLLRSIDSNIKSYIEFINCKQNRIIVVYWIDYMGNEIYRDELCPGQISRNISYATHPFRLKDKATGEILLEVVLTDIPLSISI